MAVLELLLLALCLLHRPRATATPHPSVIVVSVEAFNVCMRSSELLAGLMGSRRFRSCGTAANGFLNCLEFNSSVGEPTTVSVVQACMCRPDGQDFLDGKPGVLPRADPYHVP